MFEIGIWTESETVQGRTDLKRCIMHAYYIVEQIEMCIFVITLTLSQMLKKFDVVFLAAILLLNWIGMDTRYVAYCLLHVSWVVANEID